MKGSILRPIHIFMAVQVLLMHQFLVVLFWDKFFDFNLQTLCILILLLTLYNLDAFCAYRLDGIWWLTGSSSWYGCIDLLSFECKLFDGFSLILIIHLFYLIFRSSISSLFQQLLDHVYWWRRLRNLLTWHLRLLDPFGFTFSIRHSNSGDYSTVSGRWRVGFCHLWHHIPIMIIDCFVVFRNDAKVIVLNIVRLRVWGVWGSMIPLLERGSF